MWRLTCHSDRSELAPFRGKTDVDADVSTLPRRIWREIFLKREKGPFL